MAQIKLMNSLSGKKECFRPIIEGKVGMYVCGPTVYGEPHLGHARSAITFDTILRFLTFCGYRVRYVRNITDVGHLEDEINGSGEDKITRKARLEKLEPMEVAQYYTNRYRTAMGMLGIRPPSIEPLASGHIPEQIALIEQIIAKGFGYIVNGSVYFDVRSYAAQFPYGELSGIKLSGQQAGTRQLDGMDEKHFYADFALWKKAGPAHLMRWQAPWGTGFPGWHIECTAMSSKYLGIPFDIHGGGMDLKFPHHEAEICQGRVAFGQPPANYWVHNNMVTLGGEKMAKSQGNFITLDDIFNGTHSLLEKAYSPMAVRFYMLQSHYGSTLDFSNAALQAAEKALSRLMDTLDILSSITCDNGHGDHPNLASKITRLCADCQRHMCDDFNTAKTLAALFEMSDIIKLLEREPEKRNLLARQHFILLKDTFSAYTQEVLGLRPLLEQQNHTDQLLHLLLSVREQLKRDRYYGLADQIREQLVALNIQVKDGKDGTFSYR